jgi:hypothetical protein
VRTTPGEIDEEVKLLINEKYYILKRHVEM